MRCLCKFSIIKSESSVTRAIFKSANANKSIGKMNVKLEDKTPGPGNYLAVVCQ